MDSRLLNRRSARAGHTLFELMLVLAIVSILSAIALPRSAALLDAIDVHASAVDAVALCTAARHVALAQQAVAVFDIDTARTRLVVRAGPDTVRRRDDGALHGVRFRASRTTATFAADGLGYGVANLTLIITKRAAAETVIVSRLGRVR